MDMEMPKIGHDDVMQRPDAIVRRIETTSPMGAQQDGRAEEYAVNLDDSGTQHVQMSVTEAASPRSDDGPPDTWGCGG